MSVYIVELLPNPAGNDKAGEWILIGNDGAEAVDLFGWSIRDAQGKEYTLSGKLGAQEERKLPYAETKITLNNTSEELCLRFGTAECAQKVSYENPKEEEIISAGEREAEKEVSRPAGDAVQGGVAREAYQAPVARVPSGDFSPLFVGLLVACIFAIATGIVIQKGKVHEEENR